MSHTALSVSNISKSFHDNVAVDNISFDIPKGEIIALIGPNGAGKTTLLRLITGVLFPDEGDISISGTSIISLPEEAKREIGYMPDDPTIFPYLTGRELIFMTGKIFKMSTTHIEKRLQEFVNLFPVLSILDEPLAYQSRGTKQKILFMATLIHKPSLLIIDEPLVGLDPVSAVAFGKTLQGFAKNGGSVLIALHTLQFAQDVADRYIFVNHGKIVEEGTVGKKSLDTAYLELLKSS
jgi:ABC-2 type transport system ATP-binding protein